MAPLTPDEAKVISDHPLGDALELFRQSFRSTRDKLGIADSSESIEAVISGEDGRRLAPRLVSLLLGHDVALELSSRISSKTLAGDLAALFRKLISDGSDIRSVAPLLNAVIRRAKDESIWEAVFDLIAKTGQTENPITPTSVLNFAPLIKDTPWPIHSGNLQNISEPVTSEPVEFVKQVLKLELNSSLELEHPKFFNTYFPQIAEVTDAARMVFQECQKGRNSLYTIGKRWRGWDDHDEDGVQRSLEKCVNRFMEYLDKPGIKLPNQRRFVPSPNTPIPGSVKRKPDLCVATSARGDRIASWQEVLVAFELKKPGMDGWVKTWSDMAKFAREIFRHQDSRRFILGVTLCGSTMRLWEFDRLGATTSKPFDIHTNAFSFIEILLSFLWMDDKQLGFDPNLMEVDGQRSIKIVKDDKEERLIITEVLRNQASCIAGRATTCWKAYREGDELKTALVIKDSWQYVDRPEEGELICKVTAKGVTNISPYYHHEVVCFDGREDNIRSNIRKGMSMAGGINPFVQPDFTWNEETQSGQISSSAGPANLSQGNRSPPMTRGRRAALDNLERQENQHPPKRLLSQIDTEQVPRKRSKSMMIARGDEDDMAKDRVRRRVITSRVGKPLREASCPAALLTGILGGLEGHGSALQKANILHRDISIGNVMLDEDERNGFLIDWDLAVETARLEACGAPGRTGTKVFMAIGALDGDPHNFMHDLESFFWVLLWICVHYTGPGKEAQDISDFFNNWNYKSPEQLATYKAGMVIEERRIDKIMSVSVTAYCRVLIPCVKELWRIIFPGGEPWSTQEHSLPSQMKATIEKARDDLYGSG
ncbi:MAG: hypothetical protein M1825_003814 [Sarcosagium campestre]|nr:MAG: hypothetical protein M1825_003814 [Sarcosagium campestre]